MTMMSFVTFSPTRIGMVQTTSDTQPSSDVRRAKAILLTDQHKKRQAVLAFDKQVRSLSSNNDNWDADCVRPTNRALATTFELLKNVGSKIVLPTGVLYPDGEGGIRIEWRSDDKSDVERYVLLSINKADESKDYIYYQQGDVKGKLTTEITTIQLLSLLNGLIRPEK